MAINPKQELFCQYYVNNRETFGNATASYILAYDLKAQDDSKEEKERLYEIANASGARLLVNVKVKDRINKLLNDLLKDNIVDAELAKVIMQDRKLESKVSAIREYNKLRNRVSDNINLNLGRISTTKLQDEELNRLMEVFRDKE